MDYVVGSVAALVSGNVTPNRPRLIKRALTPTKHQPSPNVTPKSEYVNDKSIFLSPSLQKKKAVVKKSPKRIFQNPDLETTDNGEGNNLSSPKADKVKKHLQGDLDNENTVVKNKKANKGKIDKNTSSLEKVEQNTNENTPKKKKNKINTFEVVNNSPKQPETVTEIVNAKKMKKRRKSLMDDSSKVEEDTIESKITHSIDKSPEKEKSEFNNLSTKTNDHNILTQENKNNDNVKKKNKRRKKKGKQVLENKSESKENIVDYSNIENTAADQETPKKKNKRRKKKGKQVLENKAESKENIVDCSNIENTAADQETPKKKNKKNRKSLSQANESEIKKPESATEQDDSETPKKKNRKRKKSLSQADELEIKQSELLPTEEDNSEVDVQRKNIKVNPNAVTDKESDSEHESDDEIESENEEINKKVFESEPAIDESSDEEDKAPEKEQPQKSKVEKKKAVNKEMSEVNTEDDIKRTLFVGNVPFSTKCKKEIKKIFNKHGKIETIRIRTVPVKDGRYTPKLAVIKNELHPERTTVNVYIKYAEQESIEKALAENNTVINDHHLRVSRSSHTGAEHDPKCSIFIGNLPFAMEDEVLRQKFEKCGEIDSVRIIRDKKTNAGKGFGYVNFASKDGVELALALTEEDLTIKNRIIRVKRCTQLTNKQKQTDNRGGFNKQFSQRPSQGDQRPNQGNQRLQGQGQQRSQGQSQRRNPSFQRGPPGNHRGPPGNQRGPPGNQRGPPGNQRGPPGNQRQGNKDEEGRDGAYRRILHKRKNQDGADGPPNKKQNVNEPYKEKKSRKEFVGMTAEKKKKRKFDKGQKKKKALSEILTK